MSTNFWLQNLRAIPIQGLKLPKICSPPDLHCIPLGKICTALYYSKFGAEYLKWSVVGALF